LPNAGNGKRVQRYVESWVLALRKMVSLDPQILLPGHGEALTDPSEIQENLTVLADTLEFIVDHSLAGLNRGLRKDEVVDSLVLPESMANHPTMRVQYVTPQDIAKMVIRQYTGWWDDVPSHWSPAPVSSQGRMVVELAGGMERLAERAREWIDKDIRLASQLADYAFLAYPDDPRAQQLADEVYRARIVDPSSNTQEIVTYLDVVTEVRMRQQERQ
jgi:alkyl sulfatase BDS1-like metallo-beta-lactamase superfamily hydrolase